MMRCRLSAARRENSRHLDPLWVPRPRESEWRFLLLGSSVFNSMSALSKGPCTRYQRDTALVEAMLAGRPRFPAPMNPVPVIRMLPNHLFEGITEAPRILEHAFFAIARLHDLDLRQNFNLVMNRITLSHHESGN